MYSNSLATVLVKVLGLSLFINGLVYVVSALTNILFSVAIQSQHVQNSGWYLWQGISNIGVTAIFHAAIGAFLIAKTPYIVERILKIDPEPEDPEAPDSQ
jgi:hypothetical protein